MSTKSNASAKKSRRGKEINHERPGTKDLRLRRPVKAEILKSAAAIAEQYQIILENDEGRWYGRGLELPHVFGDGTTPLACIKSTRQALIATVAYLLEQKRKPPSPARNGKRTQQVNVRLTAEEKSMLEGIARGNGFQGLSDYLRAAALEPIVQT
jgi:predicted RNase H-like HicB family nuclease